MFICITDIGDVRKTMPGLLEVRYIYIYICYVMLFLSDLIGFQRKLEGIYAYVILLRNPYTIKTYFYKLLRDYRINT